MARVDKADSTIGVTRATLSADIASTDFDKVLGVSLNSSGQVVVGGGGQTGIIGVINPNKYNSKAGLPIDIFKVGEFVDMEGLAAGTDYYVDETTGALTASSNTGANTRIGFTVEATRLVLAAF